MWLITLSAKELAPLTLFTVTKNVSKRSAESQIKLKKRWNRVAQCSPENDFIPQNLRNFIWTLSVTSFFTFLLFWDIYFRIFWEYFNHSLCLLLVCEWVWRHLQFFLFPFLLSLCVNIIFLTRKLLGPGSDLNRCGANLWKRLTIFTRKKDPLVSLSRKSKYSISRNDLFASFETFDNACRRC